MATSNYTLDDAIRSALTDGSYVEAWEKATALLAPLDLAEALTLTLASVDEDRLLYDALASQWATRATTELRLNLHFAGWAIDRLREHREKYGGDGKPLWQLLEHPRS